MTPRTDHATYALVEMGLNFCCHRYAAEFMASHEVPFHVAYRVLLKPSQRRSRPKTAYGHETIRHERDNVIVENANAAYWKARYTHPYASKSISHWQTANALDGVRYR